ncbi:FMRF-amide neuropeptides [Anopheles maculipalpis]|uniref:FMRF-amide neuropeptides n=1 Tax=Anopheles maculipalpis TaxID=1496333 RepID=UPI0021594532|nr:FMRF-amide neuropeptides [Anopheles maculipalpis]
MFPCAENNFTSSSRIANNSSIMKFYLFLAIIVCESCNYFSHAEYDSLVELANGPDLGSLTGGHRLTLEDSSETNGGEWAPFYPWSAAVKRSAKSDIQTRRRSALDKNFMRFGRSDKDMLRQARANLMRFGRPDRNFLRFGRDPYAALLHDDELSKEYATSTEQLEPSNQAPGDEPAATKRNGGLGASEEMLSTGLSESGEQIKPKQILYIRRDSPKNLMRFGKRRSTGSGYLRFGRAGNLMRFGRASDEPSVALLAASSQFGRTARAGPNLMRFGRAGNLMRFGRADTNGNGTRTRTEELNGTSAGQAPDTLPPNLLELFEKEPDRMLLDALEAAQEADERLPLYIVEKK